MIIRSSIEKLTSNATSTDPHRRNDRAAHDRRRRLQRPQRRLGQIQGRERTVKLICPWLSSVLVLSREIRGWSEASEMESGMMDTDDLERATTRTKASRV